MELKSFFFYFIYTVAIFFLFLYALFPQKKAAEIISDRISGDYLKIKMEEIRPVLLPFGLKSQKTEIILDKNTKMALDSIIVSPYISALLKKEKKINLKADVKSMKSANIPGINTDINMAFKIKGNFGYKAGGRPASGKGSFLISDCAVKVENNSFMENIGISRFNFKDINIRYEIKGKKLEILEFYADGPEMKIRFKGKVSVRSPVKRSIINLDGKLQPGPSFLSRFAKLPNFKILFKNKNKDGIPVRIRGILIKPDISL